VQEGKEAVYRSFSWTIAVLPGASAIDRCFTRTRQHCTAQPSKEIPGSTSEELESIEADTVAQEVVLANFANGSISLDCHLLDQVEEKFAAIHSAQRFHLVAEMLHLGGCTGVHPEGLKAVKLALATVLLTPAKGKLQETKPAITAKPAYCDFLIFFGMPTFHTAC